MKKTYIVLPLLLLQSLIGTAVAEPAAEQDVLESDRSSGKPVAVKRLPLEYFASLPALKNVVLSPDGQKIAALLNARGETSLVTRGATGGPLRAILRNDNKELHFNWIRWVNDDRLLVSVRFAARRSFVGTMETRLLSLRPDGSDLITLVKADTVGGSMTGQTRTQQIQDRVIDWMPEDGKHVLLALSDANGALPSVYKVNVDTGARQVVKTAETNVYDWLSDAQHRVRVGIRRIDNRYEIIARDPEGSTWRTLWRFDADGDTVWPLGFGLDPQELFVSAQHDGRAAVFSVRLDQASLPRQLRLANPRYDVKGQLLRSPASGEVVGLRNDGSADGESGGRNELWATDWRAFLQSVDRALPERSNFLVGMSRDLKRYVVYSTGKRYPGEYFLGDAEAGVASLGSNYPGLDPALLAGKTKLRIKARDGLELDTLLTLPVGRRYEDAPGLPMVVLPHGGPQSHDQPDFDYWTEFLANRGYAVLQVNFRGSSGRGNAFVAAGLKRWGMEMQDDLSDAVHWAVGRKVADPKRICIVGASYGGYAALMGLVKTPELYRCGISFAGVSDLQDMVQHVGAYVGGEAAVERMIGQWWGDRERLRATSPALQAVRIQVPVLLVHGTQDRSVPVEQSQGMARALRSAGKTYRYIEQEDGDHYLSLEAHRLEFFRAMEAFLAQYLRG